MSMDITPYVERLRHDLAQAAAAGDERVKEAADRLALALDPSMRLVVMEVLSEAAAEITSGMRTGCVDVRLAGRDLEFCVDQGAEPGATQQPAPSVEEEDDDEAATARITLRLSESLKAKAEERAAAAGHSLNTWIVNVLRSATREGAINIDIDLSSIPFLGDSPGPRGRGRRMSGWI